MTLPVKDLGEAVRKLSNLEGCLQGQPSHTYGLGRHVARQIEGKTDPLEASEFYKAALSHRRESHLAPSGEEMLAVAKVACGESFANEVQQYMAQLDREKQERRPPH